MARLLLLIFLLCATAVAATGSTFNDSNPIHLVSNLELQVLDVIGQSRHALSFARFVRRHGKRYRRFDEIRHRFRIFSNNLRLIRSTNRKPFTYTLGVNRFADWTWEEFTRHRLDYVRNHNRLWPHIIDYAWLHNRLCRRIIC